MHILTVSKRNSEFSFPETLTNNEGVIPPNSKAFSCHDNGKTLLTRAGTKICRVFDVHNLIMYESKVQIFVSLGSEFLPMARDTFSSDLKRIWVTSQLLQGLT